MWKVIRRVGVLPSMLPVGRWKMPVAMAPLPRPAGALVAGKTVTTEFAYFHPGKTVNPHNRAHNSRWDLQWVRRQRSRIACCPFAFGTQTAASVIRPAAYCGIIGYKASFGSFDLQGVSGLAASLDTLGFLCRDLRDIPLVRSVLCGDDQTIRVKSRS